MVDFPKMDEVHPQAVTIAPPMDMTHQHGHMQAAPQQRSLIRTIGTFTGGGVFFLVLLVLAEAVLIDDLKPSKLWGGFMGKTQAEQIKASEAATVGLEQQLAHVRAEEQQKAQAQLAQLQNQLDTTKEAYGSLYRRSEALVTGYMSMQQTAQQYRSQAVSTGNIGATYVNMGTSFMCAISRAKDDGDADGWCASNDRVRQGQVSDFDSTLVSREQLEQQIFGGLPDPAVARVKEAQAASGQPVGQ